MSTKKLVLYINYFSPPSHAVLLTAKTLGLNAIEKNVDLFKDEHKAESFKKINPSCTVPALDDDGFCMWESRAIMGYLVQQYGKDDSLYPKDPKKRAIVDNMLYFDATTLYNSFASYYYPIVFESKVGDAEKKETFFEKLSILEGILGSRKFTAGNSLTLSDLATLTSVAAFAAAGVKFAKYPNTKKWLELVKSQVPVYNDIMKEGIKNYEAMFKDHQIS